jgi:hypothetical protein
VNDELEMISKEAVVAYSRYPGVYFEGLEKTTKKPSGMQVYRPKFIPSNSEFKPLPVSCLVVWFTLIKS